MTCSSRRRGEECRGHRPRAAGERSSLRQDHRDTKFAADDHRNFNRNGEASMSARPLPAFRSRSRCRPSKRFASWCLQGATMAAFALRWILMSDAVTVVIPGARNAEQAKANAAAASLAPLSQDVMDASREIYERLIAPHVHQRW
jgi:aryl-alcohol dehydrogenase-like predicted oxidoreductase